MVPKVICQEESGNRSENGWLLDESGDKLLLTIYIATDMNNKPPNLSSYH